jgi:hypothetical protein
METKQTVVNFLEENLIGNPHFESDFIHNINVFEQAKQMEKEQIRSAYISGFDDGEYLKTYLDLEYYNETYGKP